MISLVYLWYFFFYLKQNPPNPQVTSIESNLTLFVQPESGHEFLLSEIEKADKHIYVEVYLMSDKKIIEALVEEDKKGTDVKVILEEHPFGGGGSNKGVKKDLESGGVEVNWSNSAFALSHIKMILIDDELVFILNQNITNSAFTKNREFNILDKNVKDIEEIKKMFLADWNKTTFYPTISNIIQSPNTSRASLAYLINSAISEIKIEMEVITDDKMVDLLIDKTKTTKIKLIIPSLKQLEANKEDALRLLQNKVEVKTLSSPYLHSKLIIVDNKNAYVGSINFTSHSLDQNRELGIILSSKDVLNGLLKTFESDWQKANVLIAPD